MRVPPLVSLLLLLSACTQVPPVPIAPPPSAGSQVVVFDIDGTLTPHNWFVFEVRPGAPAATRQFVEKGYTVVYVTTRIPGFQTGIPEWLRSNGFATGPIHVAQNADERDSPERFKAAILSGYAMLGWRLSYGYGDSTTDFQAYATVRIPKDHVFALRRRGSSECAPGVYEKCLDGWTDHLPYIEREVPAAR